MMAILKHEGCNKKEINVLRDKSHSQRDHCWRWELIPPISEVHTIHTQGGLGSFSLNKLAPKVKTSSFHFQLHLWCPNYFPLNKSKANYFVFQEESICKACGLESHRIFYIFCCILNGIKETISGFILKARTSSKGKWVSCSSHFLLSKKCTPPFHKTFGCLNKH